MTKKKCTKCKEYKPHSMKFFYYHEGYEDCLLPACKVCHKAAVKLRYAQKQGDLEKIRIEQAVLDRNKKKYPIVNGREIRGKYNAAKTLFLCSSEQHCCEAIGGRVRVDSNKETYEYGNRSDRYCVACRSAYTNRLKPRDLPGIGFDKPEPPREQEKTSKKCNRCKALKPIRAFRRCNNKKDGLQSNCKTCTNRLQRMYRAAKKAKQAKIMQIRNTNTEKHENQE